MEDFRSKSYSNGRTELEVYESRAPPPLPSSLHDLRCYSASYASSQQTHHPTKEEKVKKSKSSGGWSLNDPELQRKKRVASYKVYSVEGKMKGSLRKSFRWIKEKLVFGWKS